MCKTARASSKLDTSKLWTLDIALQTQVPSHIRKLELLEFEPSCDFAFQVDQFKCRCL